MGIFSRIKKTVQSKANAAVDAAVDPEKEMDMIIAELEDQRQKALKELVSYKATAKELKSDMEACQVKIDGWEKKAMIAVKKGEDELAKKFLAERTRCEKELASIKADRDEAAKYAITLNESRKKVEVRLRILKLKKGTLVNQMKVAKAGGGNALGVDDDLFDRLEAAEDALDDDLAKLEASKEIAGVQGEGDVEDDFADEETLDTSGVEDELLLLKSKMEKKALGTGDD